MAKENRERYRRLPGRRRGFLFGSSVWVGQDHLLLVKSARFREEYKRFFFRDVQAIVTAEAVRFHLSTRAAAIGAVWSVAFAIAYLAPGTPVAWKWVLGLAGLMLAVAWGIVSAAGSCRARLYTAVSSEELPSVYRRWTARRFLAKVEPLLTQAQGSVEGPWAEAVEEKQIGPVPEGRRGLAMPPGATLAAASAAPPRARTSRTGISFLFVASLVLGGLTELVTMRAAASTGRWILLGSLLLQILTSVAVLVQNYMGRLRAGMRNLAIVTLAANGVWYYAVQVGAGIAMGMQNATAKNPAALQVQPMTLLNYPLARGIAGGMGLVLGVVGVILLLRGDERGNDGLTPRGEVDLSGGAG